MDAGHPDGWTGDGWTRERTPNSGHGPVPDGVTGVLAFPASATTLPYLGPPSEDSATQAPPAAIGNQDCLRGCASRRGSPICECRYGFACIRGMCHHTPTRNPCPPCHPASSNPCGTSSPPCCPHTTTPTPWAATDPASPTASSSTSSSKSWSSAAATAASKTPPARPPPCGAAATSGSRSAWASGCTCWCWPPTTACSVCNWTTWPSTAASPKPPAAARWPGAARWTAANRA
jgi:hypothetical protein